MSIILPKEPVKATRINAKIILLYSLPKVGKTEQLSLLENNLILDMEDGAAYYECLKVAVGSTAQIDEVCASIREEGAKRYAAGKRGEDVFPYKYISVDTADAMEGFIEDSATTKYKGTVIGKGFEGDSVVELPNGAGYGLIRKDFMDKVLKLASVCKSLIITSHIKDKNINKGGVEATFKDVSLTGKLGSILCSKVDAIGYWLAAYSSNVVCKFL